MEIFMTAAILKLKNLLKRVNEQVRALEGGLKHISSQQSELDEKKKQFEYYLNSEQEKLDKKKMQFEHMLQIRQKEMQQITQELDIVEKASKE
jgi:hypothetical protein